MIELICIRKGAWIVTQGKYAGETLTGPAFNEIVHMIDMKVVMGVPALLLAGYTGPKNCPNWYSKDNFEILISDETLAKELASIDFSNTPH